MLFMIYNKINAYFTLTYLTKFPRRHCAPYNLFTYLLTQIKWEMRKDLEYEKLYVSGGVVGNVVMNRCVKLVVRQRPIVLLAKLL